jgi:hypothetical protein
MKKVIKGLEDGIEISIVVQEDEFLDVTQHNSSATGVTASTASEKLKKLSSSLDDLAQTISTTCNRIENKIDEQNKMRQHKSKISELIVEFGLSLTAELGVVISNASAGATLKVTAKLKFD